MTPNPQHGVNYSDLSRIVMERAHSAREAVELVGAPDRQIRLCDLWRQLSSVRGCKGRLGIDRFRGREGDCGSPNAWGRMTFECRIPAISSTFPWTSRNTPINFPRLGELPSLLR